MKGIDKKQLKIISMEFRTIVSRLITCNHQTGTTLLKKLIIYIDESEVISGYIKRYVNPDDFEPVERGTCSSSVGDTEREEISYTYQYLEHTVENYHNFYHDIAFRYIREASDAVGELCNRMVLPFASYTERYLTEIGVQIGYDEDKKFMVSISDGVARVNVASGNVTVHETQSNGIDASQLENVVSDIMGYVPTDITQEEQGQTSDSVEIIRARVQSASPREGSIKIAPKGLQAISGTA